MIKRKTKVMLIVILVGMLVFLNANEMMHKNNGNIDSNAQVTRELIGNDSTGSVEVIRNIGNTDAPKIAYVVGVHPLENDTHQTLLNLLPSMDNLNYCYDIYVINVSEDFSVYGELGPDDQPGRQEGQDLAYNYVLPQILNESYELVVDVHAHGGVYAYDTFVFCAIDGALGDGIGHNVSAATQNVSYYNPYYTTSEYYLTDPLNQNGIPAFYYEENSYYDQGIKDLHMIELIRGVDSLKFIE